MMTTGRFCDIWSILLSLTRLSDDNAVNQYHATVGTLRRIEGIIICLYRYDNVKGRKEREVGNAYSMSRP